MNILVRKEAQTKWTFHDKDIFSLQISITRVVKAKNEKKIEFFFSFENWSNSTCQKSTVAMETVYLKLMNLVDLFD